MEAEQDWVTQFAKWRDEELDPELEPFVRTEGKLGWTMLKHPLVFDVPLTLPGRCNEMLAYKKKRLVEALEEQDWHTVVFLYERPYRMEAFIEHVMPHFNSLVDCPEEIRDLAATIWVDSENIHENIEEWHSVFNVPGLFLGSVDERQAFDALPDPVRVYRAGIDDGEWSWTTERSVAEFFAGRFGHHDEILTGDVAKEHVFGYLTRRNEQEILVRHGAHVKVLKVEGS